MNTNTDDLRVFTYEVNKWAYSRFNRLEPPTLIVPDALSDEVLMYLSTMCEAQDGMTEGVTRFVYRHGPVHRRTATFGWMVNWPTINRVTLHSDMAVFGLRMVKDITRIASAKLRLMEEEIERERERERERGLPHAQKSATA